MKRVVLIVALTLASSLRLCADGGRIRLHQQTGPFLVTVFTTPDPLVAGPADFSVAVERADDQGLVEDAEVTLIFSLPEDPATPRIVQRATHEQATSRFLQAANLQLPKGGSWLVQVLVSEGNDAGEATARVEVLPRTTLRDPTFWQILAVPLFVFLYLVHGWRKCWLAQKRHVARVAHQPGAPASE